MDTKVQKWGNSLGVRIPRSVADEAKIRQGTAVRIEVRNQTIVIKPVGRLKYRLADLLRQVTRRNIHEEVSVGDAVGKEAL